MAADPSGISQRASRCSRLLKSLQERPLNALAEQIGNSTAALTLQSEPLTRSHTKLFRAPSSNGVSDEIGAVVDSYFSAIGLIWGAWGRRSKLGCYFVFEVWCTYFHADDILRRSLRQREALNVVAGRGGLSRLDMDS